jgi:hypothetical protein
VVFDDNTIIRFIIPLGEGVYGRGESVGVFGINGAGRSVQAGPGFERARKHLTVLWSFNDAPIPGETPANPLPRGQAEEVVFVDGGMITMIIDENLDEDESVERPSNVAGINLTSTTAVPVVENDYGHANTVYIDPALAIGYGYTLQDTNRFRTFEIPAPLPQGDEEFEIHYLGESYALTAGQVFDFTTLDPAGVDSFLLLGIDETELVDPGASAHPPFVYGVTFMQPGVAEVTSFPLVAVPEPGALALAALALMGFVSRRCRTRIYPGKADS